MFRCQLTLHEYREGTAEMENQLVGVLNTDRGDYADLVEDGAVRNSLHAMMNKKM